MKITNFGGNITFEPRYFYTPKNEGEVLDILNKHAHGRIRVAASGHSWSDVAKSDDVTIDMRHMNSVEIEEKENGDVYATSGAGCVLQRLLDILHKKTNCTLGTLGVIKRQTISGVVSTGTHGSGRSSISHYMDVIRIAAYGSDGRAKIYEFDAGRELMAARCALGCMGVILSVKFKCVPKYYVAQNTVYKKSLDEILAQKDKYDLGQFILVPYSWKYYAYQRYVARGVPEGLMDRLWARWIRIYNLLGVDIALHAFLKVMISFTSSRRGVSNYIKWFYRVLLPVSMGNSSIVTDFSENSLTMHHDFFRHLEMEIFVPERNIQKAMKMARHITSVFAGSPETMVEEEEELERCGKLEELMSHKGFYTHHYPIFCRQVLPDDTLISMTAEAGERYFSVSFFTYLASDKRERFYEFADFLAKCMAELYDARLHWGKYFPLKHEEIKRLYPNLEEFRQICDKVDPEGVFRNEYTTRVLGF